MIILVAGSHGVTGQLLIPLLAQGGHTVRAMVRDPAQAPAGAALGGEPLIADLEADCAHAAKGCDVIMFAAGAGAGSGTARKKSVDHAGAVRLSAINAENPESYDDDSESMRAYLFAKSKADGVLRASGLDYTIVRPGRLTDEPATGRVETHARPFTITPQRHVHQWPDEGTSAAQGS
jgi:uncharacterized protein YbjT (DUF2867 family)